MVKKIYLPKPGGHNIFQIKEEISRSPSPNEVTIDVSFSGINFADIHMRQGLYLDAPKFPYVPGYEISGIIKAVGDSVKEFQVGDKVFGGSYFGGYCNEVVIPAWQVMKLPNNLSLEQGAALPVSFLTAYFCLFDEARIREGDRFLIDCASGSLGTLCLQLLKGLNVYVVGLTSSREKKEVILQNGASEAYTHDEFLKSSDIASFDIILNSLGGKSLREHYKRLGPTGRMICIGASDAIARGKRNWMTALSTFLRMPKFSSVDLMNDNKGVFGLNVLRLFEHREFMAKRLEQISYFEISPKVDKIFPYWDVGKAQAYIEEKKSKGKVLLSWKGKDV